jgi:Protein of unknown function (DUF1583)
MQNERRASNRRRFIRPLEILGVLLLAHPVAVRAADEMPVMFHHDFRGKPVPVELQRFNIENDSLIKEEPGGLRINLPPSFTHKWGGVGFRTGFSIKGDFDITLAFEILHVQVPPKGYGAGVGLFVAKGNGHSGMSRIVKADGMPIVSWEVAGKQGKINSDDMSGRLRLKRTGTTLFCLWAPGIEGGDFQEVHHAEIGDEDIDRVRLVALNGQTNTPVETRLLDLLIRSGSAPPPPPSFTAAKGGVSIALLVGLAFTLALIIALSTWVYVRGRRRKQEAFQEEPTEALPLEASSDSILFQCPNCDRKLKAKTELTGKKIKCPQCGQAVRVEGIRP